MSADIPRLFVFHVKPSDEAPTAVEDIYAITYAEAVKKLEAKYGCNLFGKYLLERETAPDGRGCWYGRTRK